MELGKCCRCTVVSELSPPWTVECPTLVHIGQIRAAAAPLDLVTGLNRFWFIFSQSDTKAEILLILNTKGNLDQSKIGGILFYFFRLLHCRIYNLFQCKFSDSQACNYRHICLHQCPRESPDEWTSPIPHCGSCHWQCLVNPWWYPVCPMELAKFINPTYGLYRCKLTPGMAK